MNHDKTASARPARRGGAGFTLIELLVTLGIAALLLTLAVPNLKDAVLYQQLRAQTNAFLASLHMARSEAIKRNTRVVICKSTNGTACVSGTSGWQQGWILFQDTDNDAVADGGETIIDRHPALHSDFVLAGNTGVRDFVSFHPSGTTMSTAGAFQAGTLTLCRATPSVADSGRQIVLSAVGRPRTCSTSSLTACPPASLNENCD